MLSTVNGDMLMWKQQASCPEQSIKTSGTGRYQEWTTMVLPKAFPGLYSSPASFDTES